jgi:uncharacterized protein YecE (DUF72 family)
MPGTRRYYIGTQGWNYDAWNGTFYPPGTKSGDRLEQYSRVFDTVEIDSTFYAMPPAERFASWYERTPAGFTFTVKLPRDITHDARLSRVDDILIEFCDRVALLREKLGPLLIQLPPDLHMREFDTVASFVRSLPAELQFAIEFRNTSWFQPRTFDLLREWDVTLTVSVGPWLTTPQAISLASAAPGRFQYLRWLGAPRHQDVTPALLDQRDADLYDWARAIADENRPITYAYFNNDYMGHSPSSARRLQELLGLAPADLSVLREQEDLFGN